MIECVITLDDEGKAIVSFPHWDNDMSARDMFTLVGLIEKNKIDLLNRVFTHPAEKDIHSSNSKRAPNLSRRKK